MGMIFKGLTFGGINSLDYGIFITGEAVYNAPERSVTSIEIEGRNGDLLIDNGRFLNIEVSYPAGCFAETQQDFKEKIELFRNAIVSQISYQRLTDEYNPDEYRLAVYKSGLDVSVAVLHQGGEFTLTFDCKPQRFLTSGETEKTIPDWSDIHSDSGSIVTIDNSSGEYSIKSLSTDIEPQQDLNGYDNPWAGGAGKNKLPLVIDSIKALNTTGTWSNNSYTRNGVTFTINVDSAGNINSITTSGTASADTALVFVNDYGGLPLEENGSYIISDSVAGSAANIVFQARINNSWYEAYGNVESTFTYISSSTYKDYVRLFVKSGKNASGKTWKPMIRLASVADSTWQPYENICPITGFDSASISRTGKNLLNPADTVIGIFWNGNPYTSSARLIVPCESSTDYVLSMNGTNNLESIYIKPTDEVPALNRGTDISSLTSYSFTTGANDKYVVLEFRKTYIKQADIDNLKLQLEHGSTATAYEPFGTEYTVSFGSAGTVYGGTLDVVSGQLTVTHAMLTLNTVAMNNSENYPGWKASGVRSLIGAGINQGYENVMLNVGTSYSINTNSSNDIFILPKTAYNNMSQSDWIALAIDVQSIIPLATPLTYQLTPTQILLMLGDNYLWGNITDISVEYGNGGFYLNNQTLFDSKPLLIVTGYGTLGIGSQSITIENGYPSQVVYIDCESMEAWTETGGVKSPANDLIQNAGDAFPVLTSGMNAISLASTISEVKITPRWWRI